MTEPTAATAGPDDETGHGGPPRHARLLRSHRVLRALGLVMTAVVVAVPVGAWALAHRLQGQIETYDTDGLLPVATDRPKEPTDPRAGHALTILIVGLDSRAGDNAKLGGSPAQNTETLGDVTILAHISADRKRVDMVSIPRDTMVAIPACTIDTKGTKTVASSRAQFNEAFQRGFNAGGSYGAGAVCTAQTVTAVTGVHVDGFVVVDFAGVEGMVDAIGGVPVCVQGHVDSADAGHLVLDPGFQKLDGWHATQYARARHGVEFSDGSDLQRILRQQELVASIAHVVLAKNLLTDYPDLVRFLDAVAKSLTMSKNLGSITFSARLGYSMRSVSLDDITLITAPYVADSLEPKSKVQLAPSAQPIFDALEHDKPIVKIPKTSAPATSSGSAAHKPTGTSTPTATPTPRNRSTQGITAAEVPTDKASCDAAIAAHAK